jgi:Zn finger protein HypA/HybF involved in hydrogenase expression
VDPEEFDAMLIRLVNEGELVAKCSGCRQTLTPEEHEDFYCPDCGPFEESENEPVYSVPS